MIDEFCVFDTNSLISVVLFENSKNAKALDKGILKGSLAISVKTIRELSDVIFREKFDPYLTDDDRLEFITKIECKSRIFSPTISIQECRDPKDDKFLELAVTCSASCIISGDKDLLVLHPFRGIPIMTPSDFLNIF